MVEEFNVLITGGGGQGGITISKIISEAAVSEGLKVRVGESLGMAQRGGAVQSHIRMGEGVYSSIIPHERADVVISLEPIEALRVAGYIGKRTIIILNLNRIPPTSILTGEGDYPALDDEMLILKKIGGSIYTLDAGGLAKKAGLARASNVVMLGAFSALNLGPLSRDAIMRTMTRVVPKKYLKENIEAFKAGGEEIKKYK